MDVGQAGPAAQYQNAILGWLGQIGPGHAVERGGRALDYFRAGESFRTICPPFITNRTRCRSLTSFSGSPSTAMMSANLPASIAPIRSLMPSRSAELRVAARRTSIGDIPAS